jgi:hypothetical protein
LKQPAVNAPAAPAAAPADRRYLRFELEDATVFLFGERLTAPISSIESWRQD